MQEYSQQFVQSIKTRLIQVLDPEKVGNVADIIFYELKDYDLVKKNTDIVPYENANERVLNLIIITPSVVCGLTVKDSIFRNVW